MAQEIRTFTWCDVCLSEADQHEQGLPVGLAASLPGAKPVTLEADLCERHRKAVEEVVAWLMEYGRKVSGGSQPAPTLACPAPGCGFLSTTQGGVESHAKVAHGVTVAELQGQASLACPFDACSRLFKGPAGLTQHLIKAHGLTSEEAAQRRAS